MYSMKEHQLYQGSDSLGTVVGFYMTEQGQREPIERTVETPKQNSQSQMVVPADEPNLQQAEETVLFTAKANTLGSNRLERELTLM